ncbi:MAG: hypothetical protein AAF587_21765 [Bacteroidota bacterium]
MKKLPKWLRILLYAAGSLLLIGFIAGLIAHESRPTGQSGPEADVLANKMMAAVNKAAWDSTGAISWNFGGRNDHLWDKKRHLARVKWGENEVYVDINKRTGVALIKGERVEGKKADKLVDKAWKAWVNDAFWLNPVVKAFDGGTSRSIVKGSDGKNGLLVSYGSGGATPGDAYLWILDEQCRPVAWKMWVKIIPIGGIRVPWEGWTSLPTGAMVAQSHGILQLTNIQAAGSLEELVGEDPFSILQ